MSYSNHGRFRQQFRFLRRQFLQDEDLPFGDVLSEELVSQALEDTGCSWVDRIYTPLVTVWVFLSQVLSQDHSCRAAVARLIAHRLSRGQRACSAETVVHIDAHVKQFDDLCVGMLLGQESNFFHAMRWVADLVLHLGWQDDFQVFVRTAGPTHVEQDLTFFPSLDRNVVHQ